MSTECFNVQCGLLVLKEESEDDLDALLRQLNEPEVRNVATQQVRYCDSELTIFNVFVVLKEDEGPDMELDALLKEMMSEPPTKKQSPPKPTVKSLNNLAHIIMLDVT